MFNVEPGLAVKSNLIYCYIAMAKWQKQSSKDSETQKTGLN